MRNRLFAAAAALVLALVGTVVLLSYVQGADSRAIAGAETVPVLVVTSPVTAGTAGGALGTSVALKQVPSALVAAGAVTDVASLSGRTAAVDLQPGEQVLDSRFVSPEQQKAQGLVAVPTGMITTTVLLSPERAVGGAVAAGDTVSVFISQGSAGGLTHLQLHSALVTAVQGAAGVGAVTGTSGTAATSTGAPGVTPAASISTLPTSSLMVTLALAPPDAERLVWGVEHGTLWLAREKVGTPDGGTKVLDGAKVYQ